MVAGNGLGTLECGSVACEAAAFLGILQRSEASKRQLRKLRCRTPNMQATEYSETHVAAATVSRADAIVSWNFKHIVRIDKMRAYNQVNLQTGFGLLSIVSPREVRFDEAT